MNGTECIKNPCKKGYVLNGTECIRDPCKKGYVKNGTECIKDPCKKGYVNNGTESECSICDTGYHRSLGKCVNTICFFIFILTCVVVVALLLLSGVIMHLERGKCRSIKNRSNPKCWRGSFTFRFLLFQDRSSQIHDHTSYNLPPKRQICWFTANLNSDLCTFW